MPSWSIRARAPRGDRRGLVVARDPDLLRSRLEDAAHVPGGHAAGLVAAASEADVAEALRICPAVLAIGAQSALTGGATPRGECLLSTATMNGRAEIADDRVRVGSGLTLAELDAWLEERGRSYPPVPTFMGAFVGGTVATNAAGAATFKYGATRGWIQALTVVLAGGDVLDIERGAVRAHPDGYFDIVVRDRTVRVPVPTYRMPAVAKVSAGYFAAPEMDLVDLFVGAEGTLGVVTEVTLRVLPTRPAACLAFVPFRDRVHALSFVRLLRETARDTWRSRDPRGLDVSAIEHMDARCLALLREDGVDRATGVGWPGDTSLALLITIELPSETREEQAFAEIGRAMEPDAPDTPLVRFCRLLEQAGVLDAVEIAVPGDRRRADLLRTLREAVPAAVNQRVARAQANVDPRIEKTAADMIVPFDSFGDLLAAYDDGFGRRSLDVAVWGHISDGNVHPNVIPGSYADVEAGREAILDIGRAVIRLGGSPLAEHGVGRNAVKQQLLRELYGDRGIDQMRRTKRAIDPDWKLAPGVLFPK
ncbi:MAG: FAD-binding oxidoreductase [Acidobacteria bacterium]|nr:FAD-binding oxidoreductase [Acidobacteriota bacterium]